MNIIHPADSLSYPIGQSRSVAYHEGAKARLDRDGLPPGNPYPIHTPEWAQFHQGWVDEGTYLTNHK